MTATPRLSPLRITDELLRARFYQELVRGNPDWDQWEVSEDERKRPDLIAYRYYRTTAPDLIVAVSGGVDDFNAGEFKVGSRISLPPVQWIRARITHYEKLQAGAIRG